MSLKNTLKKLNPLASDGASPPPPSGYIFPSTHPSIDGEECLHDCETCTIHLPKKFSIDETDHIYGEINGWSRHLIVATGKSDWVREVSDEKGSVMEAVGKWKENVEKAGKGSDAKVMLSASNIPLPDAPHTNGDASTSESVTEQQTHGTTVLLLPSFTILSHVTPTSIPSLLNSPYFRDAPTNTSSLTASDSAPLVDSLPAGIQARSCPHDYLILLCSQKTRDARCGQSAPLLKRELERHLRPLGLYRDLDDERPGGVGIYFISHVGGHKYSANMLIYRSNKAAKADGATNGSANGTSNGVQSASNGTTTNFADGKEAAQCIWLARIRPEDCENLVRYTLLQGKVVKPARQLRGGFDRAQGKVSW